MPEPLPPRLSLAVQYASIAQNLPTRTQLRRWLKVAMRHDAAMTLRIVDEAEGRELNRNYRGKDYATNVLTFVYDDEVQPQRRNEGSHVTGEASYASNVSLPPLCGDVVICAPVVEREAREQGKSIAAHYAHLVIHAALHLQGYEHETDDDAAEMEALESGLMLELRYPDPYEGTRTTNG